MGYHTLSDFRSQRGEVIDTLITQVLALLMKQDLVDLSRVAQDGTRVRASAGASSFRREATLQALMQQAREHLDAVTRDAADPSISARRAAAKAFNVQFATTTDEARVIVGVDVSNRGSDAGQSTPMLEQIEKRTGVRPTEMLVDGGYAQHKAIEQATDKNITVYAPVPKPRKGDTRDPYAPRDGDSEAVAAWRKRMGTEEAKQTYRQRAATAETVNADAKNHRGLDSLAVRGLGKVLGSAGLFALTYNVLRLITLGG